jgi:copper(I)-binding protein
MLIEKPIAEGDVVSIKLINGDEIIARLDRDDHHGITISKPLAVTLGPQGLGMIPWVFLAAKETMTLKREHIFVMLLAKKDAADQYLSGTTGIALS